MPKNHIEKYQYMQNRELSWLRFNQRVLEEAADENVPALERLKFLSIFTSNLDEFFMVRIGSLFDIAHMLPNDTDSKTGWTPKEQLSNVYAQVPELLKMKKKIYSDLVHELDKHGIHEVKLSKDLKPNTQKRVNRFFTMELLPVLSPILIGPNHPVPHLANKHLYAIALLENKKGKSAVGVVPMPESAPQFLMLKNGRSYIRTENILLHFLPEMFDAYEVKESCIISVTRNADISFDEEKFEDNEKDFRQQMKKLLKRRDHLAVVRLEISCNVSADFAEKLAALVNVEDSQIFIDECPLNMSYVFGLIDELPSDLSTHLLYQNFSGRWSEDLREDQSILHQAQTRDFMLYFPYDNVDPFLRMLSEAADNPQVLSIKITIYRLASSSKIAQILCRAAENGKEVLALMELRARFDEENNLAWSRMLEESGCQVIYGTEGFKCHSKICLITMRSHNRTSYITQIGTGNYNEKTNAMYTDLSIVTANTQIAEDAAAFFRNMLVNKLDGEYEKLCVSPHGIKDMILREIDKQIELGSNGYICIKANSVTECGVIKKLAQASQAGVEIQLIIRGICCVLPGVKGYTENIHVTSIVGRFLEHARIYLFGRGEDANIYISSADLMTRNLNRRVEIAYPVENDTLKKQLMWLLDAQLRDTAKASDMLSDGTYVRKFSDEADPFDSQAYFMKTSMHSKSAKAKNNGSVSKAIGRLFAKLLKK